MSDSWPQPTRDQTESSKPGSPAAREDRTPAPSAQDPDEAAAAPRTRILLVEDNLVVTKMLVNLLEGQNYLVIHATEAGDAMRAVRIEKPDLVILDVGLPTKHPEDPLWDGLDFLEWLDVTISHVAVIIHSSTSRDALAGRLASRESGIYLQKPARPARILEAVRQALASGSEPPPPV